MQIKREVSELFGHRRLVGPSRYHSPPPVTSPISAREIAEKHGFRSSPAGSPRRPFSNCLWSQLTC